MRGKRLMAYSGWQAVLLALLLASVLLYSACGLSVPQTPEKPESSPALPAAAPASTAEPAAAPAESPAVSPSPTPEPSPEPLQELPEDWFDDALFFGDSITGSLYAYSLKYGGLGDASFLYVNGFAIHHIIQYDRIVPAMGSYMELEDAIAASGCGKLYLMLAMNDVGTGEIEFLQECWETVLDRIREKCPDLPIYIQAGTPIRQNVAYFTRENMEAYNAMLQAVCESRGCVYVDVTEGLVDENGFMKAELQADNVHMNPQGCAIWVANLRDPARYSVTPVLNQEDTP